MKKSAKNTNPNFTREETVAAVALRLPQLRETMEKIGLDYCCGGNDPLDKSIEAAGLRWEPTIAKLEAALLEVRDKPTKDWTKVTLSELATHIEEVHHSFTRTQLERIDALLLKVERAHGDRHGDMLASLRGFFDALNDELTSHMAKEERVLFPAIRAIEVFEAGEGPKPDLNSGGIDAPIKQMVHEHVVAGKLLVDMRETTGGYTLPPDACPTFKATYDAMVDIEGDLHEHIHLENNLLFPGAHEKALAMG